MFNIKNIIDNNRSTFYNYSTEKMLPSSSRIIKKLIIALVLTALFNKIDKDLINVVLTIYSILIGFSFNILFYLITLNKKTNFQQKISIEKQLKLKKINRLSEELFYNVSYFNIISILLILISLSFFVFESANINIIISNFEIEITDVFIKYIKFISSLTYAFIFYVALTESIYTFIRTIGRVSFFFDETLKMKKYNTEEK